MLLNCIIDPTSPVIFDYWLLFRIGIRGMGPSRFIFFDCFLQVLTQPILWLQCLFFFFVDKSPLELTQVIFLLLPEFYMWLPVVSSCLYFATASSDDLKFIVDRFRDHQWSSSRLGSISCTTLLFSNATLASKDF